MLYVSKFANPASIRSSHHYKQVEGPRSKAFYSACSSSPSFKDLNKANDASTMSSNSSSSSRNKAVVVLAEELKLKGIETYRTGKPSLPPSPPARPPSLCVCHPKLESPPPTCH